MKKIIALALALIMALSMASVAFAAVTPETDYADLYFVADGYNAPATGLVDIYTTFSGFAAPGDVYEIAISEWGLGLTAANVKNYKLGVDFTKGDFDGASLIKDVRLDKEKDHVVIELKESYTMFVDGGKVLFGAISFTNKKVAADTASLNVEMNVNNADQYFEGAKKAAEATPVAEAENTINFIEKAGYIELVAGSELKGVAKVEKGAKVFFNMVDLKTADEDSYDALIEAFGEDYEGIFELYTFETKAAEDVAWTYDAWSEDPHFFYAWDGEKLTQIEAKYDADEDVDDYVFTADAAGTIIVTDVEIVLAAEETKNPDTGANDVVGVAAALAVVSLVAAGAVSLKK